MNNLTPMMTRLRMSSKEQEENTSTPITTLLTNNNNNNDNNDNNKGHDRPPLETSPVSVLMIPDLSLSAEKEYYNTTKKEEEDDSDLDSSMLSPTHTINFTASDSFREEKELEFINDDERLENDDHRIDRRRRRRGGEGGEGGGEEEEHKIAMQNLTTDSSFIEPPPLIRGSQNINENNMNRIRWQPKSSLRSNVFDAFEEEEDDDDGKYGIASSAMMEIDDSSQSNNSGNSLTRMNSLSETKLLCTTTLRRQKSNSLPSSFCFDGHFRYERRLSRTANAEVWLVQGVKTNEPFVIKKRHKPFSSELDRRDAIREIEAQANLPEHPNVVKVFRGWQQERLFMMQFEYCECGSLTAVLKRLRPGVVLDERDVWRLALEIGSGLAHIHSHSILHLDVKPENIFLSRDGTFKIGDFGLAWAPDRGWSLEEGDGGYVAPELLNMDVNLKPQPASDIFSLGATLFEVASGKKLRDGSAVLMSEEISIENAIPQERSEELRNLVLWCLKRDPSLRPTALEIVEKAKAQYFR
jgi:membrane-associated tyrosine- and threonine-specific cdc2-inhibitory kinase